MIKTYSELIELETFEERFDYLKLSGVVGLKTFGEDRYLNQILYNSGEWKSTRNDIIIRDNACDLGIEGREVSYRILIHHINPITIEDIERRRDCVFDPNNLISTSDNTHRAIHYSDESLLFILPQERKRGDTCLWKR